MHSARPSFHLLSSSFHKRTNELLKLLKRVRERKVNAGPSFCLLSFPMWKVRPKACKPRSLEVKRKVRKVERFFLILLHHHCLDMWLDSIQWTLPNTQILLNISRTEAVNDFKLLLSSFIFVFKVFTWLQSPASSPFFHPQTLLTLIQIAVPNTFNTNPSETIVFLCFSYFIFFCSSVCLFFCFFASRVKFLFQARDHTNFFKVRERHF